MSENSCYTYFRITGNFDPDLISERDAHFVRDAGFACDARLRRVCRTHCITYHSAATSLITYLRNDQVVHTASVALSAII